MSSEARTYLKCIAAGVLATIAGVALGGTFGWVVWMLLFGKVLP